MSSHSFSQKQSNTATNTTNAREQSQHPSFTASNAQRLLQLGAIGQKSASGIDRILDTSIDSMVPTAVSSTGLTTANAMITGARSFAQSPCESMMGKTLDAGLDIAGGMMSNANPIVSSMDMLLPDAMKYSKLLDGTSSGLSSMAEGILSDNSSGMEEFIARSSEGDYGLFMEEATAAGNWWAENGLQEGLTTATSELRDLFL